MAAIWIPKRLVDIGLVNTAAENSARFIQHCEFEYEGRIQAAAKEILAAGAHVVMLTGPSASGKTTTAHKISDAIRAMGYSSKVISLDNFYLNSDVYPRLPDGSKDYENVRALDIPAINKCISQLLETGKAEVPVFDFKTESRLPEWQHVDFGNGVAVIEGIHAFNPLLTEMVSGSDSVFKIYAGLREEYALGGQRVLPTRDIRLVRRMVRDSASRSHSPQQTIEIWKNVCAGEDNCIRIYKPTADLLLDTSFSYEICVLAHRVLALQNSVEQGTESGARLQALIDVFGNCTPLPEKEIPAASMLHEFLG